MDLFELIRSRRAIRRYLSTPISRPQIEKLLTAACWAPSAHNRQPWRFAVLSEWAEKDRLAQAMGRRLREDRLADGDSAEIVEQDVSRSYARITGAPTVIIVCMSMAQMDQYPDAKRQQNEWLMAAQSVSMAAQNLWLAAHSEGLAACWLCAPLFVPALVRQTLDLPTDWEPLGLMTLGYPAELKEKSRASLAEKVIWR